MKHLIILVACTVLAIGGRKDKCTYTVVAHNGSAEPAQLTVNNQIHTVIQTELKKEVIVDKYKVASLSLGYEGAGTESLTLSVYKDDKLVTTVTGNTYMYVLLSRDSATAGGGGMYRHSADKAHGEFVYN